MLRKVVLYGEPGRKFGKHWHLDVQTPGEAIRAIAANKPEFVKWLAEANEKGDVAFRIFCGKESATVDRLAEPVSSKEVIRIVPVVAGAGGTVGSFIQIGAGVIIGVAFGWTGIGASIGMGLIVSGASGLLAQAFKPSSRQADTDDRPENKPSFVFSGAVNTIAQGGCVPICYGGPIEIGSYVVSGSIDSRDIPL